jgi:hypothetical protein
MSETMQYDLIGYVLQCDDPEARRQFEERLHYDPELARQLELVRAGLSPLEADKEQPLPPSGLIARTIARVAECICQQNPGPALQPEALVWERASDVPSEKLRDLVEVMDHGSNSGPSRWRRLDVFIGGAVVVLLVGLVLAATPRLRQRQNIVACQNQMRNIYGALEGYSQTRSGSYPQIAEQPPHDTAASYVNILQDAACLSPGAKGVCPAATNSGAGYAYSLGFRAENGQLLGLRRDLGVPANMTPILADRPSVFADGERGPSPDHGYGQNVLFLGGNVRFCTTTQAGIDGDDIYHNRKGEVAAGVDQWDTVLGFGADRP